MLSKLIAVHVILVALSVEDIFILSIDLRSSPSSFTVFIDISSVLSICTPLASQRKACATAVHEKLATPLTETLTGLGGFVISEKNRNLLLHYTSHQLYKIFFCVVCNAGMQALCLVAYSFKQFCHSIVRVFITSLLILLFKLWINV